MGRRAKRLTILVLSFLLLCLWNPGFASAHDSESARYAFDMLYSTGTLPPAVAQDPAGMQDSPITITAEGGLDGYIKNKGWVPIRVKIENNGPDLEGVVEVQVGRPNSGHTRFTYPISLPSISRKEVMLYVYSEDFYVPNNLKVSLYSGKDEVATVNAHLTPLSQNDLLVGVLSGNPSDFNFLADLDPPDGNALVAQLEPADIPEKFEALNSLDMLVISNQDTGTLTPLQRKALANWVSAGGQLVVAGGPSWDKTAAGLEGLLPFSPVGTQSTQESGWLLTTSAGDQVPVGNALITVGNTDQGAQIRMSLGDDPLVISENFGSGQLVYLTLDPALAPLKSWRGTGDLFRMISSSKPNVQAGLSGFQDWYSASNAISILPGLATPPIWLFCGFLGLYILAVGPINLIVLNRLKRRELAWLSIPGLVIVFGGLAYLVGSQARGDQPVLNRLAIVQAWPEAKTAQVNGLVGVFSPGRATYQLSIDGSDLAHPLPVSPNISGSTPEGEWEVQDQVSQVLVPGVRVEVGGLKALSVEGSVTPPFFSHDLKLQADAGGAVLFGSISNDSNLTLEDAVLVVPGNSQRIGTFAARTRQEFKIDLKAAAGSSSTKVFGPIPGPGPYISPVYPYSNPSDTTIMDILGTTDYYKDQETRRRYSLLMAALNSATGIQNPGGGIYLAGWTEESPFSASVAGKFQSSDTTLYLIHFSPVLELGGDELTLPPPLFSWATPNPGASDKNSPYETMLYNGSFSVEYQLTAPVTYKSIKSLTLHLKSYQSTGESGLLVSIWNFKSNEWFSLGDTSWGDHELPDPGLFVSPGGEIRLRLQNDNNPSGIQIEAADFTMVVDR